jgi:HlyD family secretion protein
MKYLKMLTHVRKFFTKKRIIWTSVGLVALILIWVIFFRQGSVANIQTTKVVKQDVEKTVLTTGQVVSSTDLSLSFQTSGYVRRINVKEGDSVRAGQVLAVLDQGNTGAQLESARGALAQAKANYDKIRAAATAQDIAVSQAAVDSASVALENARQNLKNSLNTAYNDTNTAVLSYTNVLFSNPLSVNPQFGVQGTVQTNTQAVGTANSDRVTVNAILPKWQMELATLNDSNIDQIVESSLKYLSTTSLYLNNIINILTTYTQVTSGGSQTTLTTYASGAATAKNTVDGSYTSIITYRQAVKTAEASLASAKASLALRQAPARPEDIGIAEAQVISAQGQVDLAQSNLNNTVITAPTSGTITQIDIKLGELAQASKEVMKLLNVDELYAEAAVSEADIASVMVGQTIDNTFDSLGPDKHFESKVLTVNPASTVVSGVVNYKVTGSLEKIPGVKPGMTANMTIKVDEKKGVLVAPSGAIINKNGKKLVRVIDDPKTKTYHEVEVTTGLEADGGLVELVSGLAEGQEIVTYIK